MKTLIDDNSTSIKNPIIYLGFYDSDGIRLDVSRTELPRETNEKYNNLNVCRFYVNDFDEPVNEIQAYIETDEKQTPIALENKPGEQRLKYSFRLDKKTCAEYNLSVCFCNISEVENKYSGGINYAVTLYYLYIAESSFTDKKPEPTKTRKPRGTRKK